MYLYGPPNTGKTTLVSSAVDFDKAFFAGRDKWWMEGFNAALHSFVVIDEFDWSHFSCPKELLKLLAGEMFVGNIKGKSTIWFSLKLPVIMITNEDPLRTPPSVFGLRLCMQTVVLMNKYVSDR